MSEPGQPDLDRARSAFILLAWLAYYRASRSLQLADLVTYYFVAPLFVVATVGAASERIRRPGPLARDVLIGFAGVLIAATPSGGAPLTPVGLALLAALLLGAARPCWPARSPRASARRR